MLHSTRDGPAGGPTYVSVFIGVFDSFSAVLLHLGFAEFNRLGAGLRSCHGDAGPEDDRRQAIQLRNIPKREIVLKVGLELDRTPSQGRGTYCILENVHSRAEHRPHRRIMIPAV
jgi:hypothetical protein